MGRLIKNHWARLIILTAAAYHIAATLECFFWPKILWDFSTTLLDGAVKPVPVLQSVNLLLALAACALEWPLRPIAGTWMHSSIEVRLLLLPLWVLASVLMYQGTNAAVYYVVGMVVYFWAYADGEIVCKEPWTLPRKTAPLAGTKQAAAESNV